MTAPRTFTKDLSFAYLSFGKLSASCFIVCSTCLTSRLFEKDFPRTLLREGSILSGEVFPRRRFGVEEEVIRREEDGEVVVQAASAAPAQRTARHPAGVAGPRPFVLPAPPHVCDVPTGSAVRHIGHIERRRRPLGQRFRRSRA